MGISRGSGRCGFAVSGKDSILIEYFSRLNVYINILKLHEHSFFKNKHIFTQDGTTHCECLRNIEQLWITYRIIIIILPPNKNGPTQSGGNRESAKGTATEFGTYHNVRGDRRASPWPAKEAEATFSKNLLSTF